MGELGEIVTGSTPPIANEEYYSDKGIPWITPTDIETNIISDSAKKLSAEGAKIGRVVRANSILCTCIASIGKNALLTTNGSFNQQINSLTPYSDNDSYFLLTSSELWSIQMKQIASSGTMQIVNKTEFSELRTMIPSLPEQEAIGTFFSTLDQHIALHQRKLDTLKEQKKTYLKLLFPSKGQTKPALRFQGFEDDWEEVKLGEVLSVSKLKNKENEYSKLNVLSVSREQGTVNQIEYQGRSFASDDVSGYKIVNVGQMIYTKSPLKGAPYGIFQTVTINGIVSPLYAVYNSSGRALASFVSLILKEDAIATHYLSPLVTKGAKNTINVTDEGALEGKVKIPTLPEQQAIGTFFQTLDREISQVEDKLASLKELKKTLLRKLFV